MATAARERLVEHAIALIAQSEVAPEQQAQGARSALLRWCDRSAEHQAAAQEARRRWDALGGMAADLRTHFREPIAANAAPAATAGGPRRRRLLLSVAAMLGTGALGGRALWWYREQPLFAASYRTPTARMQKVALNDGNEGHAGSRLDLAPRSTIEVRLYRRRRQVDLDGGEVRFEVASDAARPFVVATREALVEVVGTVFTVRDRGGPINVGVERGQVRVQVLQRGAPTVATKAAPAIDLLPGQVLEIHEGAATVREADPAALSAWRDGWLIFDNERLHEALATINAYRARPIVSADPRIHALRLSGRFQAGDSAGLVAALPAILPLDAVTHPDGSVELRAR
ncbi:FecR family protein [Variovorax sp. DT-64]|uniref:FecR family protein n=1 Tax=Variovorax sp. DT-64 TaxID=3396160 RepID=UPI003F1C6D23